MRVILNANTTTSPVYLGYANETKCNNEVNLRIRTKAEQQAFLEITFQDNTVLKTDYIDINNGILEYQLPTDKIYTSGTIQVVLKGGKNMFPGWVIGRGIVASTGEVYDGDNRAISADYIPVDFNKSYDYRLTGLDDDYRTFVAAYNSNKEFLGRTGANKVKELWLSPDKFTSGTPQGEGDIAYLLVTTYISESEKGIEEVVNSEVQLEMGRVVTEYVEFVVSEEIVINIDSGITSSSDIKANLNNNNEYVIQQNTTSQKDEYIDGNLIVSGSIKGDLQAITKYVDTEINNTLEKGRVRLLYNVNAKAEGVFPAPNNANSIIHINKHNGNYDSQLGFSSNGNIYYRSCNNETLDVTDWKQIAFSDNAIVESSFETDSSYVKFGNGLMITTQTVTKNVAMTTSAVGWYAGTFPDITFPAQFIEAPYPSVTNVSGTIALVGRIEEVTATQILGLRLMRGASHTADITLKITAIGRWK